jgi:putative acetyltransferase
MHIREENSADINAIFAVNESAFETQAEAHLVNNLRRDAYPVISLVAESDEKVVGHIMFSPVTLTGHEDLRMMGIGPMAVAPGQQRKGIGSALVTAGLEKCRQHGFGAVVVLGHTWFYPQFGFLPSVRYGIRCEYDVPEDAFMVIELQPRYLEGMSGTIKYHPAFTGI